MIIERIKNIDAPVKELRKFGITLGTVLAVLGGIFLWRGKDIYPYFFTISPILISTGKLKPSYLKYIYKTWMALAESIAWLITTVTLVAVFYLVITPVGIIGRIFRKRFLDMNISKDRDSYWEPKAVTVTKSEDYERQF